MTPKQTVLTVNIALPTLLGLFLSGTQTQAGLIAGLLCYLFAAGGVLGLAWCYWQVSQGKLPPFD